MTKIKYLVVDSGAFIKNAPVHEYAENIYTVDAAIKEIKDKATRQRLQFLPYSLKIKEPSPEAYKHVLEFSKKTGDYSSLSVTDLQIIALTYQLEKENVGTDHLNEEPSCKVTSKPSFTDRQMCGFYYPKMKNSKVQIPWKYYSDVPEVIVINANKGRIKSNDVTEQDPSVSSPNINSNKTEQKLTDDSNKTKDENEESCDDKENEKNEYSDCDNKENDENKYSDCDDEDDFDEGWITSQNIGELQKKMGAITFDKDSSACVACISTDFSIQNVLLQIGLHVISVDGMLIKNARVFILRCHACFKTTSNISKKFCPNCGNQTLKRVAVTFNEEGSKNIHINFRKPINIRGTRYSLPLPKGGRHSTDPIVCEDQRVPQNRPPKAALQKIDALSADYEALSSPFAINDVYSRAASLGIRANKSTHKKKNPNAWSLRTGNKKKK